MPKGFGLSQPAKRQGGAAERLQRGLAFNRRHGRRPSSGRRLDGEPFSRWFTDRSILSQAERKREALILCSYGRGTKSSRSEIPPSPFAFAALQGVKRVSSAKPLSRRELPPSGLRHHRRSVRPSGCARRLRVLLGSLRHAPAPRKSTTPSVKAPRRGCRRAVLRHDAGDT
jgi:hypothetical protein